MSDDPAEIFGTDDPEGQYRRAMLWPVINWLLPLRFDPPSDAIDMLASRHQPLPAVPRQGEFLLVEAFDRRIQVDRVTWDARSRVMVRLVPVLTSPEATDALKATGWDVFTVQDEEDLPEAWGTHR
jgi:hypothetical protein